MSRPAAAGPTAGEPLRLIGAGGKRGCYAHPRERALCIKVPFTASGAAEARREATYLARVERRHGPLDGAHVARCHGSVATTRGTGWLFDRVLDEGTGAPSPTLTDALDERAHAAESARWEDALERFLRWTAETALVVRDLTPDNFCVRRTADGALRLVLIDGIGPAGTLPRWLPTRAYARSRNARHAARYGLTSVASLLERCREYRAARVRGSAAGNALQRGTDASPRLLDGARPSPSSGTAMTRSSAGATDDASASSTRRSTT